jgi:hypothetical protein
MAVNGDPATGGDPTTRWLHTVERLIAAGVAVGLIVLVSFMILSTREFDEPRVYFLKILLSLAVGIVVATIPGFFNVEFNLPGLAVRAAGGAAAFVFVYTQSPSVPALGLAPPKIEVSRVNAIDFRSLEPPGSAAEGSAMAITVPIEAKNSKEPSRTGTIGETRIRFALSGKEYVYQSYYFVKFVPGPGGSWLSSEEAIRRAQSSDLRPGEQFSEEVMHLSQDSIQWADFIAAFRAMKDPFKVTVEIDLSTEKVSTDCVLAPQKYVAAIEKLIADGKSLPGYISAVCERVS